MHKDGMMAIGFVKDGIKTLWQSEDLARRHTLIIDKISNYNKAVKKVRRGRPPTPDPFGSGVCSTLAPSEPHTLDPKLCTRSPKP